jgi:hypothetical protein
VATFTQLASGNWRVQVRRKTRYVAETFRRRKDGEEWALEMERNIDRNGSSSRVALQRRYEGPWSILDESIWSLTSPRSKRISSSKKFRSSPQKDFFNTICQKVTFGRS